MKFVIRKHHPTSQIEETGLSSTGWCVALPEAGDERAEFRRLLSSFSKMYAIGVNLTVEAPSLALQMAASPCLPEQAGFGRRRCEHGMSIEDSRSPVGCDGSE